MKPGSDDRVASHRLIDRALGTGLIPDSTVRRLARRAARQRTVRELEGGIEAQEARRAGLLERMSSGPVAEATDTANLQHYEVPSGFFRLFLGPWMKYSACRWPDSSADLDRAEEATLGLTCERAGIEDGMEILDLGCGWGSMSLWIATNFPHSRVLAVSNSRTQRESIEADCRRLGIANVEVVTADVNEFTPGRRFDRVVSVEMFEHLRNWQEMLGRISGWLEPGGRLFVHVFTHRRFAYRFTDSWFASRFFTAGTMPSQELMLFFQDDLEVLQRWSFDGTNYAKTLEAWLERLDERRPEALEVLRKGRSKREAREALAAWRVFLIAAAETWNYNAGQDWTVSHYLLAPGRNRRPGTSAQSSSAGSGM